MFGGAHRYICAVQGARREASRAWRAAAPPVENPHPYFRALHASETTRHHHVKLVVLDMPVGRRPDTGVVNATRMQGHRSRRAVAAVTAVVLILVGWVGAHHRAEATHVHDAAGQLVHAQELAERHASDRVPHLHGTAEHQHAPGACTLIASVLAPATVAPAMAVIAAAALVSETSPAIEAAPAAIATYRFAPKTSPPART